MLGVSMAILGEVLGLLPRVGAATAPELAGALAGALAPRWFFLIFGLVRPPSCCAHILAALHTHKQAIFNPTQTTDTL